MAISKQHALEGNTLHPRIIPYNYRKKEASALETLITCHNIAKSMGSQPLFQDLSLSFGIGEKTGLTGSNGCGKSTLIKILSGVGEADSGRVTKRKNLKTGLVPQMPQFPERVSVIEAAIEAAKKAGSGYESAGVIAAAALSKAGFQNTSTRVQELSGGWKKRLSIVCGCLGKPDFVFLDEPTNHLDWDGILWLNTYLRQAPFAWLAISHDRYLLNTLVTRVIEISSAFDTGLLLTDGNWQRHLANRKETLAASLRRHESLRNRLRREEAWLHQGPKARGTKARFRAEAAEQLKEEVYKSSEQQKDKTTHLEFSARGRKTKKLIELKKISLRIGEKILLQDFSAVLTSGNKVGILGSNGCGKTSMFRLLTGELSPESGEVVRAPELKMVYFDQHRAQLNPMLPLKEALSEHGDHVIFQGRQVHITSWARRFGFHPERLDVRVSELSGGEQARVLIANLMLQKADVLLLDEPTNDLDIPTIEVLEEALKNFPGACLIISHDRYLLSQICNRFFGFGKDQQALEFADISQWLACCWPKKTTIRQSKAKSDTTGDPRGGCADSKGRKLSFKEKREYEGMEERILFAEETLEQLKEKAGMEGTLNDPEALRQVYTEIRATQEGIDMMYKRWSELEERN